MADDLNLTNLTTQEQTFLTALQSGGMPTTDTALKQQFQQLADQHEIQFSNDSAFSPFWRLLRATVTAPVLWLVALQVRHLMPQQFVATATGTFLDQHGANVNLTRKPASQLQGQLTFSRAAPGPRLTIPIHTPVKTVAINGTSYQVSTTAVAELTGTDTSVTVAVVAEHPGSAYNLAAGYFTIMEQPVTGVDAVTNAGNWITTPGADLESDGDLRLRIRDQFAAVNQFHTNAVYRAMIARQIALAPDQVHFEHNAPRGPGSANAYVLFDSGIVSDTYLKQINDYITNGENHGHGDDLLVLAMPGQSTPVSATLIYNNTLISTELTALQQRVEQMIRCAFRENSAFKMTQTQHHSRFSFSRLGEELHQSCTGLISITWGQTDVVTTLAVARLASLNLTWTPEAT